ncbi:Type I secretion membrane fusion protein, HlyD family [uncultured delta proteobacterium]|uniref:Type I secretion membrane fusion protein, HlyD family n=1 Tax=uncultured delta proteobacterium TaxID=34034 RepID=A0A212KBR7_9DELT|nr:Type I secretion membrane fusion protein, HlyD family [uncultured delta proteobacterium]
MSISSWLVPPSADPADLEYMSEVDKALQNRGHPLAYIMSLAVLLFFAVFLLWASWAKLDEVTRGMGQVIPSQRTQEIQNLEGGILETMFVREGVDVNEGQPLAKLSPRILEANLREAQARMRENEIAITRLQAEIAGSEPVYTEDLMREFPAAIRDQMAAYRARMAQFLSEAQALQSQIDQRNREVEEALSKKAQIEENLRITIERRNMVEPLVRQGIYSRLDYLQVVQQVKGLEGDLNTVLQSIEKSRSSVKEAEQRMNTRRTEIVATATDEMSKRRAENSSLRENVAAIQDRLTRTEILSPMRGTVKRILINTVGGVIKPGETILELVPLDDTLLVEARIKPTDIGFIKNDQKAMIKLTAYDFSIYGGLEGFVEDISADSIEDKKGEPYFQVKLRTTKSSLTSREGKELPIKPGMQASVDIITGEKTVLAYLLKPITKAKQNALTER